RKAEADEPRPGQDGRVDFPVAHLAQSRVDVAAQRRVMQLGAMDSDQSSAARRRRPDRRAGGKLIEGLSFAGHDDVARVGSLQDGGKREAVRLFRGQVLEAVNAEIDGSVE